MKTIFIILVFFVSSNGHCDEADKNFETIKQDYMKILSSQTDLDITNIVMPLTVDDVGTIKEILKTNLHNKLVDLSVYLSQVNDSKVIYLICDNHVKKFYQYGALTNQCRDDEFKICEYVYKISDICMEKGYKSEEKMHKIKSKWWG